MKGISSLLKMHFCLLTMSKQQCLAEPSLALLITSGNVSVWVQLPHTALGVPWNQGRGKSFFCFLVR